jgi:micrococcal nuclease
MSLSHLLRAGPVLAFVLVACPALAVDLFTGIVTHVSDGDTLWVAPDDGGAPRKLRIDGIDAPEICQAGGMAAREALARQVLRRRVAVAVRRHDDYGRGLAQVQRGPEDVGALMVREGQAWSYRYRNNPGMYAAEERLARSLRHGLFMADLPERPGAFRKRHGSCHPVTD